MITQEDIDAFQRFNDVDYLFNEYQDMAASTAIYRQEHQVIYPALGLAAEAGEVANKVKKMLRDDNLDKNAIASEIGDVLWYAAMLSKDLNIELHDVAMKNLEKLYDRKERGTIQGDGDER